MLEFVGSILDTAVMVGFGTFVFFRPDGLTRKDGTPEEVASRVRFMKRCGAGLVIAGVGLFVAKLFT